MASSACLCGGGGGGRMLCYKTSTPPHSVLGLYCQVCGREWLTKKDLCNDFDCKNFIADGSLTFYLNQRKQSFSKTNEDRIRIRRERVADPSRLRAGDHIQWDEGKVSNHAIIVAENSCVKFKKSDFCQIEIIRCPLNDVTANNENLIRYQYDGGEADRVALVAARAQAWVGQGSISLFTKNTESFAMYCKVGALLSWTTIWCLGNFMACIHEMSTDTFWRTGKEILFSEFFEVLRLDAAAGRDVSVGFVIMADASSVIFDLQQLYTDRPNRHESRKDFLKRELRQITERINAAGFTIESFTEYAGTSHVNTISSLKKRDCAASVGLILGSIIGGDPIGIPERICGTTLRRSFGRLITMTVKYDERLVEIDNVRRGDQIVTCRWLLHPRCHAIVLEVDVEKRVLKVIRNTPRNGVIEESLEFVPPVYRVTYADRDRRPVEEIIRRARSKLNINNYNLLTYNCKHFAEWCVQW